MKLSKKKKNIQTAYELKFSRAIVAQYLEYIADVMRTIPMQNSLKMMLIVCVCCITMASATRHSDLLNSISMKLIQMNHLRRWCFIFFAVNRSELP